MCCWARPALSEIARVTYLRLEIVDPRRVSLIAGDDLAGDDNESRPAVRLRTLEAQLTESPADSGAVLSLSTPAEPPLGRGGERNPAGLQRVWPTTSQRPPEVRQAIPANRSTMKAVSPAHTPPSPQSKTSAQTASGM